MRIRDFWGIFTLCCVTICPAWADRSDTILDACLEYQSCVLSLLCGGSIGTTIPSTGSIENDAAIACSQANSGFVSTFSSTVLNKLITNAIQVNAAYGTCAVYAGGDTSLAKAAIQEWLYPACKDSGAVSSLPTNTEYYDISVVIDSGYNMHLKLPIKTCPDGGKVKHFTINQYIDNMGIENCYTTTFSDGTGSGVFTSDCYYTK